MLIAHGYPPRETAGTERHVSMLARDLQDRGHIVQVVAATRAPGRNQYAVSKEAGVIRVVNNLATRALADGESDSVIDGLMTEFENEFKPDIVHIHHIQFLSSTMKFRCPTVVTLHDEWAWCAAGGLSLQGGTHPCQGPKPSDCASCHASWRPGPSTTARALTKGAGLLRPIISPERLHGVYRKLPQWVRPSPIRGGHTIEPEAAARYRNEMVLRFFETCDARISPSQYLSDRFQRNATGPVEVIRHGLDEPWFCETHKKEPDAPFVHVGTIAHHKGTDRVVAAWRSAFPSGNPPLLLHGPILDPDAALGHSVGAVLDPKGVRRVLSGAKALVLGARWPENAPLIILEARAVGCPVIAPSIGGIPEILTDGIDGILVAPADDSALVEAMKKVAGQTPPTPSTPPRFSTQVDAIEQVYKSVSSRPQK
jgi:glycosyltransferase involved in cell wall biosynthesis